MAKSSKKKQKIEKDEDSFTLNPIVLIQRLLQGRSFLSLGFFKRYWIYVVAGTVMMLMYISNKYVYQSDKAKLGTMKVMLNNASTDFVDASSRYNSRILESQMKTYVDSMGLDLNLSKEPPYKLTER
ncbi:MAG: hypothetical protein IK100_10615 [Muribaculaceae bacterium]|nr:hypothetical protein [Muribaculaceae bacterium]MBR5119082.1 hypothetical protein [Muribaculaceae bacterium]